MPQEKCINDSCKNKRRKNRRTCYTCDKRKWRNKYPIKAAFQTLRYNARRRHKEFTLTFEQFQQFCYETNYMSGKGRQKLSYSIDREDNTKGYTIENIKILSVSENSKKRNKKLLYDWESGTAIVI